MGQSRNNMDAFAFAGVLKDLSNDAEAMPCACGERTFCGDINISIDAQGGWQYNAMPIARPEMVRLFASMLQIDDAGHHWLVTPTEMGRICVEDAPLIVSDFHVSGDGNKQILCFCTNVDDVVCVCKETPIVIENSPHTDQMTAYVMIGGGLKAKIDGDVFKDLKEFGVTVDQGDECLFGVWSNGIFFPLL